MRIRVVFALTNPGATAPFHHQHLISELVNQSIDAVNPSLINYPNCTYSGIKGQTKVTPEGLSFSSSRITIVFASQNQDFIDNLIKGIFSQSEIMLGQLRVIPENVVLEDAPSYDAQIKYITISPIIVTSRRGALLDLKKFISPENDMFSDLLYESTMGRMEKTGLYTQQQINSFYKFQIVPDANYLEKIRREEKKFARIYTVKDGNELVELRGYTFPFTLYAAPEVNQFIFENGLGEHTNKGYGMVDMAENQFQNRIKDVHFERNISVPSSNYVPREKVA